MLACGNYQDMKSCSGSACEHCLHHRPHLQCRCISAQLLSAAPSSDLHACLVWLIGIAASCPVLIHCPNKACCLQLFLSHSHALLQEEYELDNGTAISPCAPKHWRERHEIHRVGAFHQLHVRFCWLMLRHAIYCSAALLLATHVFPPLITWLCRRF